MQRAITSIESFGRCEARCESAFADAAHHRRDGAAYAYADRIIIRQDGMVVGKHARVFGWGETVYNLWNYLPVLARKPGALRNGAPSRDWVLPAAME